MSFQRLFAVGFVFLAPGFGTAQTANPTPTAANAFPYLSDPRLEVKKMKPLSERQLKDTQQLVDILKKTKLKAATKKMPDLPKKMILGEFVHIPHLLNHLTLALKDPLYPAKVRAAQAVADDYCEKMCGPPPPRGGRAGIHQHRQYLQFKKSITDTCMQVIMEKKYGLGRLWLSAGFPRWWRVEVPPGFEGLRPRWPGIDYAPELPNRLKSACPQHTSPLDLPWRPAILNEIFSQ